MTADAHLQGGENDAALIAKLYGENDRVAQRIASGAARFSQGSVAAVKPQQAPATDGIRPHDVSEAELEQNPLAGKVQIQRHGDVYTYVGSEVLEKHKRFNSGAVLYTLSHTPPYENVNYIEKMYTVAKRDIFASGEVISRGRKIRREDVMPVEAERGNYLDGENGRVFAEPFYYTPPSTASSGEKNMAR